MTFTDFFLEMLNGGAITPELLWLILCGRYLSKEATRRELDAWDWFSLPPSMNLILAVFISDAGVWLRSTIIWHWRWLGGGAFNEFQIGGLIVGGALIVLGFLCKIRAMTAPDQGDGPWLAAAALTIVVLAALLVFH